MGADRDGSSASDKESGRQKEDVGLGFLSSGDLAALSLASVIVCTFAAVVSIVFLFTKTAAETMIVSSIALVVLLLGIVAIKRSSEFLRRRLTIPAYLLLAVLVVVLGVGLASHFLWPTPGKPGPPPGTPSPPGSSISSPATSPAATHSPAPTDSPTPSSPSPPEGPPVTLSTPNKDVIVIPAVFSPDGDLVAGGGNNNSTDVYAWNAQTGKYLGTLPLSSSFSLQALAFTPDNKSLMVLDAAGGVCRWNLSGTQCQQVRADPGWSNGQTWNSAISGDGSTVAFQDPSGTGADVVSLATGRQLGQFPDPDSGLLAGADYTGSNTLGSAISLDQDGRVLTVGDADGNLYVWDVTTSQLLATLHFSTAGPLNGNGPAATLSPDGQTVLVPYAGNGAQSTLWNVSTKADVTPVDTRWPRTWSKGTGSVFFTSDGQGIVTYRDDGSGADVWDAATRAPIAAVSFSAKYPGMGLEVYAASGGEILTDDGNSRTFLWAIP